MFQDTKQHLVSTELVRFTSGLASDLAIQKINKYTNKSFC